MSEAETSEIWPPLPLDAWKDTYETLHMWMQVVGKVKLELAPFLNEWWEVAFQVTSRGVTTSAIPYGTGIFEVNFDFIDHNLFILTSDGRVKTLPLIPRSVADFYKEFMAALHALGISVKINPKPSEVENGIPFDVDTTHASYDPEYVNRWWRVLVQTDKVLQKYRSPFVGKSSPIQVFWGGFDLAETRFSGRPASAPEGADRITRLSEDQEHICCGFWPGSGNMQAPAFYSYTFPEPAGLKTASIRPASASYNSDMGEFILMYDDVRKADAPEQMVLEFFQSTYEAGANLAHWNQGELERQAQ